jgi:hypothetical protein
MIAGLEGRVYSILKPPVSAFWRVVHIEWRVWHGGTAFESLDYGHVQPESLARFRCDICEVRFAIDITSLKS